MRNLLVLTLITKRAGCKKLVVAILSATAMMYFSRRPLTRKGYLLRWGILGICTAPLLGTYVYNRGWRIPFLACPLRHFTGIPCPTCGMTRSFMAIGCGDWNRAFAQHLFGPFLFVSLAIAVIHITLELKVGYQFTTVFIRGICDRKFQILGLFLFFGYYAIRLYFLSNTGELYLAFIQSPLGQSIVSH